MQRAREVVSDWLASTGRRVRDERLIVPLVVGLVLRVVWAAAVVGPSYDSLHPAVQNLRMLRGLAARTTPQLGGEPSAYLPAGTSLILSPVAWVAGRLDLSLEGCVAAVHVVLGTLAILLGATVATRRFGPSSGRATVWLLALCPVVVAVTPVATSHTLFAVLVLGTLVLLTPATGPDGEVPGSGRRWAAVGLMIGAAVLVDPSGLLLVPPAILVLHRTRTTEPAAPRRWPLVVLGLVLVLGPWTLRNGMEVGVWTPLPTRVAATICMGAQDDTATEDPGEDPVTLAPECHRSRLFRTESGLGLARTEDLDGLAEESEWFASTLGEAIWDRITDPVGEIARGVSRVYQAIRLGRGAVALTNDLGAQPILHGRAADMLDRTMDATQGVLVVLAALAWAVVRRCRDRVVGLAVLGSLVVLTVGPTAGHPPVTLVVLSTLLAGGFLGAVADAAEMEELPDDVEVAVR